MGSQEQLDLLKQGRSAWNAWRAKYSSDVPVDLHDVFFDHAILDQYNLSRVDLSHATFWRCSFIRANLNFADLSSATFFTMQLDSGQPEQRQLTSCLDAPVQCQGGRSAWCEPGRHHAHRQHTVIVWLAARARVERLEKQGVVSNGEAHTAVEHQLKETLVKAKVLHQDETGLRVGPTGWWVHVCSTN